MEEIDVRHNEAESRFESGSGDDIAVAEYRRDGDRMIFTHTEVPESMEGRGVAGQIVRKALDFARREKLTVVPQCAYVSSFIRRNPEYGDLVDQE